MSSPWHPNEYLLIVILKIYLIHSIIHLIHHSLIYILLSLFNDYISINTDFIYYPKNLNSWHFFIIKPFVVFNLMNTDNLFFHIIYIFSISIDDCSVRLSTIFILLSIGGKFIPFSFVYQFYESFYLFYPFHNQSILHSLLFDKYIQL